MKRTSMNPAAIAPPVGPYTHGVVTEAASRWLHISGQVGIRPDGSVGEGVTEQAEIVWSNLRVILEAAGMDMSHLVKVTAYLTRPQDFAAYAEVRGRHLGQARPASTGVVVQALARPEWVVEVEAVAAA